MSFRLRSSKFRHVFGSANKKEFCYESIKITKNAHDNNFCEVNPKFLSVVTESAGGGSFLVLPLEKTGRVDPNSPKVSGHTGPILDIKWSPFSDHVIASASDDATVKLWQIPDSGLEETLTDWLVDLHGHTRRAGYLEWHPTAENVLLSAGYDFNCILWNVEVAEPLSILSMHPDNIFSIAWNYDGSLFATTCKDKNLRVIDPRQESTVSECAGHQGSKASKVKFLGRKNKLFSVGFSRSSERQYGAWDLRNMSKALKMESIDNSSGVMFPFCDNDNNVIFVAGKGDGNIRYYEAVDDAPFLHYLNQYQSGSPQRGLGVMPKRGLDPSRCEIMRFYKMHSVKALVEPISMIVPRKSEMFHDDIYPPTRSVLPSLSADEWIAGSNRDPILMSLKDGQILASSRSSTSKAMQHKDGGVVPTPTITTYKSVRRGQSVTEGPSVTKTPPVSKAMSMDRPDRLPDRPDRLPASVRNIAKLSNSDETEENTDVSNKIGMFEKKNQQNPSNQREVTPDRWSQSYQSSVRTEVTGSASATNESPSIHLQVSGRGSRDATSHHQGGAVRDVTSHHQGGAVRDVASHHQGGARDVTSHHQGGDAVFTDSDTLSDGPPERRQTSKKRGGRSLSYRRRREKRYPNESSDQDTFSTPPTSPGLTSWQQNPVFGADKSVDISALDDALHDFEELSKTFHPDTQPKTQTQIQPKTQPKTQPGVGTSSQTTKLTATQPAIQSSIAPSPQTSRLAPQTPPPPSTHSSREEMVSSKSLTNIGSVLERGGSPQLSGKLSQSAHTIHPEGGSPDNEMIDFINTDAPDNTLIKPSKLRQSMKSKRRATQEVASCHTAMGEASSHKRRSSVELTSQGYGPQSHGYGPHTHSPGPYSQAHRDKTHDQREKSPEWVNNSQAFHRGGSLRERNKLDNQSDNAVRRTQSMRIKDKKLTIVEMNSSQVLNNNSFQGSGKVSPGTVSRPLQLALEMGTSQPKNQANKGGGQTSKQWEQTNKQWEQSTNKQWEQSPNQWEQPLTNWDHKNRDQSTTHREQSPKTWEQSPKTWEQISQSRSKSPREADKASSYSSKESTQRQDSFTSSTRVHLHSPVSNTRQVPNDQGVSNDQPLVRGTSPTIHPPNRSLQFTPGTTHDTHDTRLAFSPTDGSGSSFASEHLYKNGDVDSKIHVKKVWSPRSPSQSDAVFENGEIPALPTTDPELRKAYFRQLEEIESLKQQISYKDKRIRQLEEELRMLRLPNSQEAGESTC